MSLSPRQALVHRKRITYASPFAFSMWERLPVLCFGEVSTSSLFGFHLFPIWFHSSSLSLQQKWFHPIRSSYEKVLAVFVKSVFGVLSSSVSQWMDHDVSVHKVIDLVVVIPTSPSSQKSESGCLSYDRFCISCFCVILPGDSGVLTSETPVSAHRRLRTVSGLSPVAF